MNHQRWDDLKALARMAARLGGRDPDEHVTIQLGGIVPFEGPAWRYPDFVQRAEAAYVALTAARLELPSELDGDARASSEANGDDEPSKLRG